jgi:hypothetical protein
MKLKSILAAVAFSAAAASSFAATETITYTGSDTVLGMTGSLFDLGGSLSNVMLDGSAASVFTNLTGKIYTFTVGSSALSHQLSYNGTGTSSFTWLTSPSTGGGLTVGPTVSAVPEPETYAMLMAGLGVVGFMARRRKSAVKA